MNYLRQKVRKMSSIVSLGTAVPAFKYKQEEIAQFMMRFLDKEGNGLSRKIKVLYDRSMIHHRHSPLPDYLDAPEQRLLFLSMPMKRRNPALRSA